MGNRNYESCCCRIGDTVIARQNPTTSPESRVTGYFNCADLS